MLRTSLLAFAIASSLLVPSSPRAWAQRPERSRSVSRDAPSADEQDSLRPYTSRKESANLERRYARPVTRQEPVRANPYARHYQYFPRPSQSPNANVVRRPHHCVPSRHAMLTR